jgi:hypothetical protein
VQIQVTFEIGNVDIAAVNVNNRSSRSSRACPRK